MAKVLIFGGSASGTTTLGSALADLWGGRHLDADEYYWEKTDPPFQFKVDKEEREAALWQDFSGEDLVVVSGSLVSWQPRWQSAFDLAVLLYLPPEIRLQRLLAREHERYGANLETDDAIKARSKAFIEWARQYDDPEFDGRSWVKHQIWLQSLSCQTLVLEGNLTVKERLSAVLQVLKGQ